MAADDNIYRSAPSLAPTVLATAAARIARAVPTAEAPARQRTVEYPRPRAATSQPVITCSPRNP